MRRRRLTVGYIAAIAIATALLSACGPSPSPSQTTAGISATPTASSAPGSPAASPTPIGPATPTPAPTGPKLSWTAVLSSRSDPTTGDRLKGGIAAAASFGDGFVLVGSEGQPGRAVVWYSPDGSTWESIDNAYGFADSTIRQVVPFSGGLLAVGTAQTTDNACKDPTLICNPVYPIRMWLSSDGRTWKMLAASWIKAFGRSQIDLVAAGPSGLVVFGEQVPPTGDPTAMVWTSSDGKAWKKATQFGSAFRTDTMLDLEGGPSGYVAVGGPWVGGNLGQPTKAWRSTDGRTWQQASGLESGHGPGAIWTCAAGFLGLAGSSGMPTFWVSADGTRWTARQASLEHPIYPADVSSGIYSDGSRIVALGRDWARAPGAWLTSDGINWQPLVLAGPQPPIEQAAGGTIVGIMGKPGLLVTTALGSDPDTMSWTFWLGKIP
jgi:hypothetical protein